MEKRYLRKDGSIVWCRASVSATYTCDGEVEACILVAEDITQRKLTEHALHVQTERLDLATRSAGIGIWDWNIQTDELIWDDRMYALYGIKPGDFTGAFQAWLNGVHPEDRSKSSDTLMRAVRGEREYDADFRVLWPDGSTHILKASGHVLRNEVGLPLRMIGVNYDITERKRSESRFRQLVDSNAQGVMFWKSTGEIFDANDAFLRLVDYTREELEAGRINWKALTPPEYEEADQRALEAISLHGSCDPVEKEWIRKDGTRVPVYLSTSCFEDARDQGVTFAVDLTERKRAEHAQRLSEERFSHAFEYAPNGMILVDIAGQVVTANRVMSDLTGYPLEELAAKTFDNFTHPDDVPKELELVRQSMSGEIHYYQLEQRYIHKLGHEVWVQVSASLIRDSEGQPLYFIKQVQNISAIKQANQQIAEQAALIDEASDAIFSRDLEHHVIFWGKGAERLLGWTAEEAKGQSVKDD